MNCPDQSENKKEMDLSFISVLHQIEMENRPVVHELEQTDVEDSSLHDQLPSVASNQEQVVGGSKFVTYTFSIFFLKLRFYCNCSFIGNVEVASMDESSDENDEEAMLKIGEDEYPFSVVDGDVALIARMTSDEKDAYIELYQKIFGEDDFC